SWQQPSSLMFINYYSSWRIQCPVISDTVIQISFLFFPRHFAPSSQSIRAYSASFHHTLEVAHFFKVALSSTGAIKDASQITH
ncbi:Uncharacterized protein DAT39_008127, partial [Clarias magur]